MPLSATNILSPYNYENIFNVYSSDNMQFYNLYNNILIDTDTIDATLYSLYHWNPDADNYYSLSFTFYGTIELWWVALIVNNIINPFDPITAGTSLKILNGSTVSIILNQIATSKNT